MPGLQQNPRITLMYEELKECKTLANQLESNLIEVIRGEIVRRHVEPVIHAINDPRFTFATEELSEQFRMTSIPRRNLLYRLIHRF